MNSSMTPSELSRSDGRVLLEPHLILVEHGLETLVDDLLDEFSDVSRFFGSSTSDRYVLSK